MDADVLSLVGGRERGYCAFDHLGGDNAIVFCYDTAAEVVLQWTLPDGCVDHANDSGQAGHEADNTSLIFS